MENKQEIKDEKKNINNKVSKENEDEKMHSDIKKEKENDNYKEDEKKYQYYSYKPSKYKSILSNYELSDSDKKLLDKYDENNIYIKNKLYNNIENGNLYNNFGFTKKLTYNYETLKNPKPKTFSLNDKYKPFNKTSKNLLNYDYLKPLEYLYEDKEVENKGKEEEEVPPKTYMEKNNLSTNNIAKDIDLSYKNLSYRPSRNATYSIKSNYSYKDYLNNKDSNNNKDYCTLNSLSYNVSKKLPTKVNNLLHDTTLEQYHVPHSQYSIKKKPVTNYSSFDYVKYTINNNYKTLEPFVNDNNDFNKTKKLYNIPIMAKSDISSNIIPKTNYSTRRLNLKYNTINNDDNNNNFRINSKTYNTFKYIEKNKDNNTIKSNLYNKNNQNENKKENETEYINYLKKNDTIEPYQYNTYQTILQDNTKNNEDLIIKNKRTGAVKDEREEIVISTSPTDFYYNTLHEEFIPKTKTIPVKTNSYFNRNYQTYQMLQNDDYNTKNKNLFSYSSIMNDLINKNKNKIN